MDRVGQGGVRNGVQWGAGQENSLDRMGRGVDEENKDGRRVKRKIGCGLQSLQESMLKGSHYRHQGYQFKSDIQR